MKKLEDIDMFEIESDNDIVEENVLYNKESQQSRDEICEKTYNGFICYKVINIRLNQIIFYQLITFHSFNLLFISDMEGKLIIINIETEEIHFASDIKVLMNDTKKEKYETDNNPVKHFIVLKENQNDKSSLIYFLPKKSTIIQLKLELHDTKLLCIHKSTKEIIFKNNQNKLLFTNREYIIKIINFEDILGNIDHLELDFIDDNMCIAFNKY